MDDLAFVTFLIGTLFFIMWVCVTVWEIPVLKKLNAAVDKVIDIIEAGKSNNVTTLSSLTDDQDKNNDEEGLHP